MQQQSVVSIADLRFFTVSCPVCHTRVTVDLGFVAKSPEFPLPAQGAFLEKECPRCSRKFDGAISAVVQDLQNVYHLALVALGDTVTFTGATEVFPSRKA